jgi:cytoskeletal protein CcmA (bactofilin family)
MLKKKKSAPINTFLGTDTNIEGTIDFQGTIRLDGNVKGKIISTHGTVIIGQGAFIEADIHVEKAIIMGDVKGSVDATEKIEVFSPGSVEGNIRAPIISIDTGVKFTGTCNMNEGGSGKNKSLDSEITLSVTDETNIKSFPKTI